ncbi:MAG: DNA polymerase III subunit chi [Hirschia sp.]|nr:DNA polymerase III subunit chi [Hirschia sp.]MBF18130.1 DNA polymerase III subunit chi [Hirschia sp.]|tara:strand:- start:373 stop:825 length:453 start_codon:yes stop_codon:yes gene_type:complete
MSAPAGEWWFYHLERGAIEAALGPLLDKCLQRNWRVLLVADTQRLRDLDSALWTWKDDSFTPHGLDNDQPERQPILISANPDPKNNPHVLVLLDGSEPGQGSYERIMVVFDGADTPVRNKARQQFKAARDAGAGVRYFQQTVSGGWEQKA